MLPFIGRRRFRQQSTNRRASENFHQAAKLSQIFSICVQSIMGKSDISFVFTLRPSPSFLLVIPLSLPLSSPSTYTTFPICTYTYIFYCRQLSALAFLVVIVSIHPPPHFSPTVSRASRLWAPSFLVSSSQVPRCFGDVLPPLVTPQTRGGHIHLVSYHSSTGSCSSPISRAATRLL